MSQSFFAAPGGLVMVAIVQPYNNAAVSGLVTIDARVVHKKESYDFCQCGDTVVTQVILDAGTDDELTIAQVPLPLPNCDGLTPAPSAVPVTGFDTSNLLEGPHTIDVIARDACPPQPLTHFGADRITIIVDRTPPVLTILSPDVDPNTPGVQVNAGDPIFYGAMDNGSGIIGPAAGAVATMGGAYVQTVCVADKAGNSAATDVEVIRPHLDNGTIRAEFTDYGTSGDRIPHSTAVSASIAWLPISTSTQVYSWEGNLHYDDGGGVANHLLADPDEFTVAYALHREGDPLTLGSRIENSEFRIVATHSLNEATLETQLQVTNIAGRDLAGVNFAWLLDADLVLPQPDPCCPPLPWLGFGAGRWSGPDGQGVQTNLNLCAGLVPANIEVRHLARLDGTLVPNAWSVCNPAGFQGSTCHFDGPVQGEPRYLFNLPFDNTAGCVGFDQDLGIVTGYAVPQWPSGVTHAFTYTLTFRQPGDGDMNGDGVVDLGDMDLFVAVLLGQDTDWCRISSADLDHSGSADGLDIQLFVNLLLAP